MHVDHIYRVNLYAYFRTVHHNEFDNDDLPPAKWGTMQHYYKLNNNLDFRDNHLSAHHSLFDYDVNDHFDMQ